MRDGNGGISIVWRAHGGTNATLSHSDHPSQPIVCVNGVHGNGGHGEVRKVSEVADLMSDHPEPVRRWAEIGPIPPYCDRSTGRS